MPNQPSVGDMVFSFLDLAVSYVLPGAAGKVVSAVLPAVADIVVPYITLDNYVTQSSGTGGASIDRVITLQDGVSFTISISQNTTPELHEALVRAHGELSSRKNASGGSVATYNQQYFSWNSGTGEQPEQPGQQNTRKDATSGGSFSLLGGGLIGVSW